MPQLSGTCLCGNISFTADTDIIFTTNCHCTDCRAATGAAYGTLLFVDDAALKVSGTPSLFKHVGDSGAKMEKGFCPDCGSQMFSRNSNRPNMMGVRAGVVAQADLIEPDRDIYMSSKLDSTPVNPEIKAFDKMPG